MGKIQADSVRYKETATDFLYDAQVFEDGAIIRKVGGGLLEMISIEEFKERFSEYFGDHGWHDPKEGPPRDGV